MYRNPIVRRLLPSGLSLTVLLAVAAHSRAQEFYVSTDYGHSILHYQNGTTTTFATADTDQLALDPFGTLYGTSLVNGNVYKYAPGGTRTVFASGLNGPNQMTFDRSGNLFVGVYFDNAIHRIAPNGSQTIFQNGVEAPQGMTLNPAGDLFVTSDSTIVKYDAADAESTGHSPIVIASGLGTPVGLALGPTGTLFTADFNSAQVYTISPGGTTGVFASGYGYPDGVAFDGGGNMFVTDLFAGNVYEYAPNGTRTTLMTGLTGPQGIAVVPEPSTWALAGTALTAMLIFRRRR